MIALVAIGVLVLLFVAIRLATEPRAKKAGDTQPITPPPKAFTPLADALAESDVFKDEDSLAAGSAALKTGLRPRVIEAAKHKDDLPAERVLPHKRAHRKKGKP